MGNGPGDAIPGGVVSPEQREKDNIDAMNALLEKFPYAFIKETTPQGVEYIRTGSWSIVPPEINDEISALLKAESVSGESSQNPLRDSMVRLARIGNNLHQRLHPPTGVYEEDYEENVRTFPYTTVDGATKTMTMSHIQSALGIPRLPNSPNAPAYGVVFSKYGMTVFAGSADSEEQEAKPDFSNLDTLMQNEDCTIPGGWSHIPVLMQRWMWELYFDCFNDIVKAIPEYIRERDLRIHRVRALGNVD